MPTTRFELVIFALQVQRLTNLAKRAKLLIEIGIFKKCLNNSVFKNMYKWCLNNLNWLLVVLFLKNKSK